MNPADVLREDRRQAKLLVERIGLQRTRSLLRRAQAELERRLSHAIHVPGEGTWTSVHLRQALAQVRLVTAYVQGGIQKTMLEVGARAAEQGGTSVFRHLVAGEEHHAKTVGRTPLRLEESSLVDVAARGVNASILRRLMSDPAHPGRPGILQRYGEATVEHFEDILQQHFAAGTEWEDTKTRLKEASPFLRAAPGHWAERIVRTESMGVLNRANLEATKAADSRLGDVVKILSATFDDRTAADSYAVHGQVRRPEEPFSTWEGLVMHPPARPNDREIMVTHRIAWPIPPYLTPRSRADVVKRWKHEGRKGAPPPTPPATTVPLSRFGKG